ncbi:MAG: phosphopantetheine-binding protein [Gammaproteobacteria bacterium]
MAEDITMDEVYKAVEAIIIEQCNLAEKGITGINPHDNLMADIGIESVDFLVVVFEIEDKFDIKIPMEEWMQKAANSGAAAKDNYRMSVFVENIHGLIK